MDKNYDHGCEDEIYARWKSSGKMRADANSKKKPFTIPLPPPNVTGQLHLGHAAMLAIEDILIRFKKMTGHEVLWVPGTDHAAIATENVVIKHLGLKSREELTREEFLGECRKFATEKHDRICHQMEKMGAWLDWSREAYTFDEKRNAAVNEIFKKLYEDGLIVRGSRMINWSTGAQSVLADDELEWEEVAEPFFYIKCGEFAIGTVRPETKCADSPVVVHPEAEYVRVKFENGEIFIVSKFLTENPPEFAKVFNLLGENPKFEILETFRGSELVGRKFEAETFAGTRKFEVIADEVIDPKKGTGAMTISCHHSADDYDLMLRTGLKKYGFDKIGFDGRMLPIAGACAGMKLEEARKKSGKMMREAGLLTGMDENYTHRVPKCYRSDCVVEPMVSPQWFVAVEEEFEVETGEQKPDFPKKDAEKYCRNVEEFLTEVDAENWRENRKNLPVGKLPAKLAEDLNLKTREVFLDSLIFAKIRGWHDFWDGHAEITPEIFYLLPFLLAHPTQILENRKQKRRILLFHGKKVSYTIVLDIGQKNHPRIITFFLNWNLKMYKTPKYQKKSSEGLLLTFPSCTLPSLRRDLARLASRFSSHRTLFGYSDVIKVFEKNQVFSERVKNRTTLKKILQNAVREGHVKIIPERFEKIYFQWIDNLRDWCISRQIWWGHQIPVWYDESGAIAAVGSVPDELKNANLRQDSDTLDTWFSSALWPFSILDDPVDAEKFYPNDVLETGHDILFFWVARMILMGKYATGKYPFHTVYLHGLVTDEHGKKMSKSKGNGIDPIEVIEKFGADPVRLALVIGTSPGNPIPIGRAKISGYRNFVNKLWNAGRFVQFRTENKDSSAENRTRSPFFEGGENEIRPKSLAERWIWARFAEVSRSVAENLENYKISSAGDEIYHFVWGEFCDWFIETSKIDGNPAFLRKIYGKILALAHPIAPFVTERIFQELRTDADAEFLVDTDFPRENYRDPEAIEEFERVQEAVGGLRKLRASEKVNPKQKLVAKIDDSVGIEEKTLIAHLAGLEWGGVSDFATKIVVGGTTISVEIPVDEARREAEIAELRKSVVALEGRLANKNYVERAPEKLVATTREELKIAREKLESLTKK